MFPQESQIVGPGAHRVNSPMKSFTIGGNAHGNGQPNQQYHQQHDYGEMYMNPNQLLNQSLGN